MNANFIGLLLLFLSVNVNGESSQSNSKDLGVKVIKHSGPRNKSKFEGFGLKPLQTELVNENVPGPFCQSIVAYYVGTLQNKKSNKTYDVQFQAKLWADQQKKKIHVMVKDWTEKYSNSSNFELDYYYDGMRNWCDIYDDECTLAFAKKETNFTLNLNTADGNYFHLLNFDFFNNSFSLKNAMGKCTKHQLDDVNDNYTPNLNKLPFCVCCDEFEPDTLLGCPNNDWNHKETTCPTPPAITNITSAPTQCPKCTTPEPIQCPTPEPIQSPKPVTPAPFQCPTIPPPPQPKDIQCKEVVGYYNGLFKNDFNPHLSFDLEFQARLVANDTSRRISMTVDHWNEQRANSTKFVINADYAKDPHTYCTPINSTNCSIPFADETRPYFNFYFDHLKTEYVVNNYFRFLWFPNMNNIFTLTNAVGQCTKNQWHLKNESYILPDPTLYDYCLCCGNEYDPHPSLGCPRNPWATKIN